MLSTIPIKIDEMSKENIDKEILRAGIIAEYDATNLYEQMAALAENENVKATLLDIAKEEKTHVGEFQAILMRLDDELERELEKGKLEANELND